MIRARRRNAPSLLGPRLDPAVFGGSFALSMLALAVGAWTGVLHDETPSWAWLPAIVLVDVAHVWATAARTYLDPVERAARRQLFALAPMVGLVVSAALFSLGPLVFWRSLTYLAIFHFVRQQYGWVALYRARAGDDGRIGRIVDTAAIYAATLYPLLYWHAHVPRRFSWFVPGDVAALPPSLLRALLPLGFAAWALALTAYVVRAVALRAQGRANPGKDVVVVTTAIAWYLGIVTFDSDYAFTVTNVFMHGIPYLALVFVQSTPRGAGADIGSGRPVPPAVTRAVWFLGALWAVAFAEELLWDRAVWHDREWLFGEGWALERWQRIVVPLLALPQLTHYVLDGFIWRRRRNPRLAALVAPPAA